ncbi:hypothetical protein HY503_01540 [Candidatus Woesebacteria bacterium]|nr:hypothetical protein [Candidatus Woesebacteria bacterium]
MDLVENRQDIGIKGKGQFTLGSGEVASLLYHDIFDYPLSLGELIKWQGGKRLSIKRKPLIINKNGFYFIEGREGTIFKRLLRERISLRKLEIARKAGKILRLIPTIRMVAVTGALSMESAGEESDIDLMIVAQKGTLWTTRVLTLIFLDLIGFPRRIYADKNQKDKLCLNIWLDETSLTWPKKSRNSYTAHEICQIRPLVNKDKTYEKFIYSNRWVKEFWPNAVGVRNVRAETHPQRSFLGIFELLARSIQFWYMRGKITREVVTKSRALFHPHDWGKVVLKRLAS